MNTTLTEHTTDYYEEYYPTPRVEKAIFKYLDDLYYVSEDDVFFTIYKKENDWFMKIEDIAKEIETLFGLSLPERIKVGPDKHIEPARNPIPNRVIKNWTAHHQTSSSEEDKEIAEVLKEHVNPKLINKFLKEFWPQHRSQIYSQLYNTYHPSNYEENFNRPSGNFEDALETVADAVHEGKKLGLLDSSVDWSDTVNYDDDWIDGGPADLRFIDDDGIPTLNNQLEILDNTNLDWIHGILLFDVLEDIVEEFRCYCGENGVDPKCEGKCMDEFPPDYTSTEGSSESFAGTLKQDYYTLFNFMRELERAGVPVSDYMKDPTYPNIIKLVDDGSTDYDTTGEYSPMRQDSEAIDTEELFEDAPDRIYEHKDSKLSPELMVGDEILVVADGHDSFDKRPELYIPHVVIGVKYTPRTSSKYYEIEPIDMTDEHRLGAMLAGGGKSRQILLYPGDEWVLNPGFLRGELTEEDEIELSPEDKKTQIDRLETELDIDREDLKNIEKELDKINSPDYKGTSVKVDKDDEKKSVIGIGKDASGLPTRKIL